MAAGDPVIPFYPLGVAIGASPAPETFGNNFFAQEAYWEDHFHQQLQGKNGGGDPWHTDGRLEVAILVMHTNSPPPATNTPGIR